jgi:hypothetical protein
MHCDIMHYEIVNCTSTSAGGWAGLWGSMVVLDGGTILGVDVFVDKGIPNMNVLI